MKQAPLILALVSSSLLPAAGQELDLMVSRMNTREVSTYVQTAYLSARLTAYSLRYGLDLATFGPITLQLHGTYQAEASAAPPVKNRPYTFSSPVEIKLNGAAVGLQAQWQYGAEFGIGPELRREHENISGETASQTRPWLNARLGWNMPRPGLRWVAGLECAWALKNSKRDGAWGQDNNGLSVFWLTRESFLLSFAPNSTASVYVGARF
jgi:hypothetical protein